MEVAFQTNRIRLARLSSQLAGNNSSNSQIFLLVRGPVILEISASRLLRDSAPFSILRGGNLSSQDSVLNLLQEAVRKLAGSDSNAET